MLSHFQTKEYSTYAFRFLEPSTNRVAQVWSVGWDEATSTLYSWDGNERKDGGKYIFQYTISGYGMIDLNGKSYKLDAGKAFIVGTTGDYRYYLPKESEQWEFLFLTLYGDEVAACWDYIQRKYHSVIRFHPESAPIRLLAQIFKRAGERKITDSFQASSLSYRFIMELYQYVKTMDTFTEDWPESIISSILFARNHYQEEIGPDEMAHAANLSRYHFSRLFKETTGMTPIQYLTKMRVQKAAELLHQTKYSIEEIAENVGYANANYLTKVFRKMTGYTPGQYRKSDVSIEDHIMLPK
ncbi:AraC family transcriptional regulator [Bacillus sp. CGMCC 1.16541]|uniref:AraC family transcriptional regulator n=1 Tax=Bacillus sp. CGMCC 1.16541 TaxID=2185143 RepID=UPI000D72FDC2|nr:AraC family transcriptional regulator [Bacillus sp. CGMCC 1.16541]